MYHRFTHKKRYRRKHKTDYHVFMRRLLRLKPDRSLVVAMICRINVNTKLAMEQTGQHNKTGTKNQVWKYHQQQGRSIDRTNVKFETSFGTTAVAISNTIQQSDITIVYSTLMQIGTRKYF